VTADDFLDVAQQIACTWRRANNYCLKHQGDVCHVTPQGQHCHAAFTGDLAPALLALGAEVEIATPQGRHGCRSAASMSKMAAPI